MSSLRSPNIGDKRKLPRADSERPSLPAAPPLLRNSPPTGHRKAQALAQRQYMPSGSVMRDGFPLLQPSSSSRLDVPIPNGNRPSLNGSAPPTVASEPRNPHPTAYGASDDQSGYQIHPRHQNGDGASSHDPLCRPTNDSDDEDDSDYHPTSNITQDACGQTTSKTGRGKVPNKQAIAKTPLGRPYVQWGNGQPTGGILIPDGWTTVFVPKYGEGDLYICPVRSCRKLHESASNLKAHFNRAHCYDLFNDNRDGTISAVCQRKQNEQGRVIISQNPLPPGATPPPEPQPNMRTMSRLWRASGYLGSEPTEAQVELNRGARARPENDEQAGSKEFGTAWDVVNHTYGCISDVFPECPDHDVVLFLANLDATRSALEINMSSNGSKEQSRNREFRLPENHPGRLSSLKAALAQAHGEVAPSPCQTCAAGKGFWKVCTQAPTISGNSEDVFGGVCPSCYHKRTGNTCSGATSHGVSTSSLSMFTTTEFAPARPFYGQNAESVGSSRQEILSPQPFSKDFAESAPLEQVPQVSDSQSKRRHGSRAVSSQNALAEQDHGTTFPQVQPRRKAVQKPSSVHPADEGDMSQGETTTNDARTLPAGGQTMDTVIFEFQDMAWGLVRRIRELPLSERQALLDRVEESLSLLSLDSDVSRIIGRISELPVERQPQISEMVVKMLRQFLG